MFAEIPMRLHSDPSKSFNDKLFLPLNSQFIYMHVIEEDARWLLDILCQLGWSVVRVLGPKNGCFFVSSFMPYISAKLVVMRMRKVLEVLLYIVHSSKITRIQYSMLAHSVRE